MQLKSFKLFYLSFKTHFMDFDGSLGYHIKFVKKFVEKKMLKRWPELYGLVLAESAEKRKNQFKVSIKKSKMSTKANFLSLLICFTEGTF